MSASPDPSRQQIEAAIERGARAYFDACRARIPAFVDAHFTYPGTWHTNRVALGLDILRAPVNLLWAPLYAAACVLRFGLRKAGQTRLASALDNLPAGLTTQVQRHSSHLISRDLLACNDTNPNLESHILTELQALCAHARPHDSAAPAELRQQLQPLLEDALVQYNVTRTASADISNTLGCTLLGALAFQKFTPGGVGLGLLLAALWAREQARQGFFLGPTLGGVYYDLFPPQADASLTAASILLVLLALAALASFSGLLSDPLQAALGLHRRRLRRLIDGMERDFISRTRGSFRPKDQFVARVLDAFDMIKSNFV